MEKIAKVNTKQIISEYSGPFVNVNVSFFKKGNKNNLEVTDLRKS